MVWKVKYFALFLLFILTESASLEKEQNSGRELLTKQKNIYDLLNHLISFGVRRVQPAKEFFATRENDFLKPDVVTNWLNIVKGGLTTKNKIAAASDKRQVIEGNALFELFYYAKDYKTFFEIASWARESVNEIIFTYILTLAVTYRIDTQGILLPPFYETFPFFFTNYGVLRKSSRIKTQGYVTDHKLAKLYGVDVHDDSTYSLTNIFSYEYNDKETKLSYFTNDLGLNNYYYNIHMKCLNVMTHTIEDIEKRRDEVFYFVHQQLLARYTMARFSNTLGNIPKFSWHDPIKTQYNPQTATHTGAPGPVRPAYYTINPCSSANDLQDIDDWERRIRDAINDGQVTLGGLKVSLKEPEDFITLSKLIRGNTNLMVLARKLLGGAENSNYYTPSTLEQEYSTTRDPMFYQLYARLLQNFHRFNDKLPPYTKDELTFEGVNIEGFHITPLTTYFESFDFDITNGVFQSREEIEKEKDIFTFAATQSRLNHVPFSVTINVTTAKDTDASVRVFLAPKNDQFGRSISLNENKRNFIQLDFFKIHLNSGENTITRKSTQFAHSSKEITSSRKIYEMVENTLRNNKTINNNDSEDISGWPLNLLIPKGSKIGFECLVYVVVTSFSPQQSLGSKHYPKYDSGVCVESGNRFYETRTLGFPFDRTIDAKTFFKPNIYFTEVKIFHEDSRPSE